MRAPLPGVLNTTWVTESVPWTGSGGRRSYEIFSFEASVAWRFYSINSYFICSSFSLSLITYCIWSSYSFSRSFWSYSSCIRSYSARCACISWSATLLLLFSLGCSLGRCIMFRGRTPAFYRYSTWRYWGSSSLKILYRFRHSANHYKISPVFGGWVCYLAFGFYWVNRLVLSSCII